MAALLEVKDLEVRYGSIEAVCGVSFQVEQGQILTIIGANGAGKSSTLLALSGLVRPSGLVQVPEGRAILNPLSVEENLELGAWTRKDRKAVRPSMEKVYALFPALASRSRQLAGSLSGGEQQMLAIGRALMAEPRLLILDEPSMGLAPLLVKTIFDTIVAITRVGTTVLLVEQNARQALRISDRAIVLSHGRVLLQGPSAELLEDPVVIEAFLGKS